MDNIVKFKRSSVTGKLPLPSQLAYGELAVNFSANNPFLSIKNNQDQIEKFLSEKGLMSLLTESYYDKQTINQMFEAFNPSGDVSFDNYYEKAEADAKFQTQSGMSSYLLASEAENLYQPKGNYLTEHQDISYLATKQELESYQSISGMTSYLTVASAESTYQPKGTYVVPSDLNDYALKSEIPSIEGLATEAELANYQPVSSMTGYSTTAHTHSYNDLTDKPTIPSTSGLASETWVTNNFAGTGHTHSQYLTQTSADSRYARVVSCTQAEYDALVQNDQIEQGVLYCIYEDSQSTSDSGGSGTIPDAPDPIIPDDGGNDF